MGESPAVCSTSPVSPRPDASTPATSPLATRASARKEFDTVILANPLARTYQETTRGRRLFYVAIRATARWVIVPPDEGALPLPAALGIWQTRAGDGRGCLQRDVLYEDGKSSAHDLALGYGAIGVYGWSSIAS